MSVLFSLDAQRCGVERHVLVEADGFGISVALDGAHQPARSFNDAMSIARDYLGKFLQPAERAGIPWGLRVTVPDGVAVYGEWPLTGGGGGSPGFQKTPLARIRDRWAGSSALSALENAMSIVREYGPRSGRRAA